nr:peptidoglycan DD-metalloendopeptidase family protein [Aquirhabdus parva]
MPHFNIQVSAAEATPRHPLASLMSKVILVAVVTSLVGCASAPSTTRSTRAVLPAPTFYTVQSGDTISKIAMRYGLDYQNVARMNQIGSDYVIYVGQRLRLVDSGNRPQVAPIAPDRPLTAQPLSTGPITSPAPTTYTPPQVVSQPGSTAAYGAIAWRWPTDNPVTQSFNVSQQVKGLRFSGNAGDPVRAAAEGTVIYASNGLPEYGNLVLIQHANGYITAYAHNQRLLVQEKTKVSAGQQVAEMGSSGTNRVMLEFQVRLNGKPMDPALVLPKR